MTDKNNETKVFGEYDASVVSSEARAYTMTTTDDEGAYYEPPSYSDVAETTTTTDDTDYDSGLVRSIDINPWRKDMKVRETFRFTANVYPENAANKAVYWNTGNSSVATVDSFGNVTATGEGHTFVFATAKDGSGVSGNAVIYVTTDDSGEYPEPDPNPDIGGTTTTTDNTDSGTEETYTITIEEEYEEPVRRSHTKELYVYGAQGNNLFWSSANANIATVDNDGIVTGQLAGTTTITVRDGLGGKGTYTVTVTNYGDGGEYVQLNDEIVKCFGYALKIYDGRGFRHNSSYTSHMTADYACLFQKEIEENGFTCVPIAEYNSPIDETAYRVAVRVPMCRETGKYYHIIYQLSDGTWAGKDGSSPSIQFSADNPSECSEMWSFDVYPKESGTIYFAIKRK